MFLRDGCSEQLNFGIAQTFSPPLTQCRFETLLSSSLLDLDLLHVIAHFMYFLASFYDCACLRLPQVQKVGSYPSLANQPPLLANISALIGKAIFGEGKGE